MRRPILMISVGVLLCTACVLQLLYIREEPIRLSEEDLPQQPVRERITFILGEDRETDNPFYREATLFYSAHPSERTDYLVSTCRSLLEVNAYLKTYPTCNGEPWGVVNLVTHGNPWAGMSVRVSPGSKRSTPETITSALEAGSFVPFADTVVDTRTEIILHGCGLGQNQELIRSVARAFACESGEPVVRASLLFEQYTREQEALFPERYLSDAYFISFPMGSRPDREHMMNAFREKYPAVAIDWHEALMREQPRWTGDPYFYSMEVPLKAVVPAPEGIAVSDEAIPEWVGAHPDIMKAVAATGISASDFAWAVRPVYVDNPGGTREKALLVKGYATLIVVLKALTIEREGGRVSPFDPDRHDLAYYACSQ